MIEKITAFFQSLQNMPMPGIYFVFPGRDKGIKKKKKEKKIKIADEPVLFLDTSALIDGRIADIIATGFVTGTCVVPDFILQELHQVADSKDNLKRNRGRRGLEVLSSLKKSTFVKTMILKEEVEQDQHSSDPVDARLLTIAKQYQGRVVTNDYNLNKVGKVTGVQILNVNELSNAVKTIILPGEEFLIKLLNRGKEKKQAIGYLPDGTMVVIEDGSELIGEEVKVRAERLLQTEAGRIVFARVQFDNP